MAKGRIGEWWAAVRNVPPRFLRVTLATTDDHNAWNLCVEIFWASILGGVAAFNAAFAVRLGAENTHIGWLSSFPALLAILISIPAGRFLERRTRRKAWIMGSLFLHRLGFLLVALVPWLPVGSLNRGAALVIVLVAIGPPAHFFSVGFNAMLADVIPERRRATVFTTRSILNVSVISLVTLLAGQWLNHVTFPINYQAMYVVGFVASMVSMVYLLRIHMAETPPAPRPPRARQPLRAQWQALRETMRNQHAFVRITINTLLHGLGVWTVMPLYILYFVRELDASDAWIGLHGMIANATAVAGYLFWRRQMTRWGESKTLKWTILGAGLYPLLVGLSPALTPILFVAGLNGLISPGINLSHFSTLLKTCPADRRPSFIGVYTTIMNVAAFVCPLIGVALANRFGLSPILIGCGIVVLIGSLSFRIWPVRVADTEW